MVKAKFIQLVDFYTWKEQQQQHMRILLHPDDVWPNSPLGIRYCRIDGRFPVDSTMSRAYCQRSSDVGSLNSFLSSKSSIVCHCLHCRLHSYVYMPDLKRKPHENLIFISLVDHIIRSNFTFAHETFLRKSILYGPGRIRSPNTTWPKFSAGEFDSSMGQKSKWWYS